MKRYRYILSVFSIVMGLTLISSFVFASDTRKERESLKGVKRIGVLVEFLDPEIEKDGLTRNQIQADVELKLTKGGIKVLKDDEVSKEAGKPYLYINTKILKISHLKHYNYCINAELRQQVYLSRGMNSCFATTWSRGLSGISRDLNDARSAIKDLINIFLNAYLSVNPNQ